MSAAAAVERGRIAAEALMVDTFTAYAHTTARVDNRMVRTEVEKYTTPGKVAGRSRGADPHARTETIGDVEREVVDGGLHIPLSAGLPAIGWEFMCVAVGIGSDPSLLGRRWRVTNVPAKSYATARRLDVVEVPQPQEAP